MKLSKYSTSELVERLHCLDERYLELKKATKAIACPDAKATLQIQLDVYKTSKALILEEIKRRQLKLEL